MSKTDTPATLIEALDYSLGYLSCLEGQSPVRASRSYRYGYLRGRAEFAANSGDDRPSSGLSAPPRTPRPVPIFR
jgi:hypothetical protein